MSRGPAAAATRIVRGDESWPRRGRTKETGARLRYARPGAAEADCGYGATAQRLAPLAVKALQVAGYSEVVYAYRIAEGGIVAVLLSPTFRVFAERLLPMLSKHVTTAGKATDQKRAGAKEAELALRLYYFACGEAVQRLRDGHEGEDLGGAKPCSDDVLDALGRWIGPTQWLYAAHELSAPQATPARRPRGRFSPFRRRRPKLRRTTRGRRARSRLCSGRAVREPTSRRTDEARFGTRRRRRGGRRGSVWDVPRETNGDPTNETNGNPTRRADGDAR